MIRTHSLSRTRHTFVMLASTAIPTAWFLAQFGFARGMKRRAVSLLWLLLWMGGLNAVSTFAQGIITTVAGSFSHGFSGDGGPAVSAQLDMKHFTGGVAVDMAGNVYIADTGNHRVRKIDTNGIVSTAAGNGAPGLSGDGGAATNASLFAPTGLGLDAAGILYIIDTGNQRIRRVGLDGIITTVAGNGARGFSGDGGLATASSPRSETSNTSVAEDIPRVWPWTVAATSIFLKRVMHAFARSIRLGLSPLLSPDWGIPRRGY